MINGFDGPWFVVCVCPDGVVGVSTNLTFLLDL